MAFASNFKPGSTVSGSAVQDQGSVDALDRELILLTQQGLPLVPLPYQFLAEKLNTSADDIMQRLSAMQASGRIRRIAAVPNHYKLGFRANGMTVWDVDDQQADRLGQAVGQLDFVSHCYLRPRHLPEWSYNLFAMVHGRDRDDIADHIEQIKSLLGEHLRDSDILYSTRILKKTGMRFKASKSAPSTSASTTGSN